MKLINNKINVFVFTCITIFLFNTPIINNSVVNYDLCSSNFNNLPQVKMTTTITTSPDGCYCYLLVKGNENITTDRIIDDWEVSRKQENISSNGEWIQLSWQGFIGLSLNMEIEINATDDNGKQEFNFIVAKDLIPTLFLTYEEHQNTLKMIPRILDEGLINITMKLNGNVILNKLVNSSSEWIKDDDLTYVFSKNKKNTIEYIMTDEWNQETIFIKTYGQDMLPNDINIFFWICLLLIFLFGINYWLLHDAIENVLIPFKKMKKETFIINFNEYQTREFKKIIKKTLNYK